MKKILAIGNSFSQDATALVEYLSPDLFVRNLYIGGCTLQKHCEMMRENLDAYSYQHNGVRCVLQHVTMDDALTCEKWDVITVQQASGFSGIVASFDPYLPELLAHVRQLSDAEIVFHRTWAYETGATNAAFSNYANNRHVMWRSIKEATDAVCAREHLPILLAGDLIAALRTHDFFDVEKGGVSLCRDGYHLSLGYGRLAAAAAWIKFFTGKTPAYFDRPDLSEGCRLIKEELEKLFL